VFRSKKENQSEKLAEKPAEKPAKKPAKKKKKNQIFNKKNRRFFFFSDHQPP
jgi:hypothetical protein